MRWGQYITSTNTYTMKATNFLSMREYGQFNLKRENGVRRIGRLVYN